jgi:hypothetical protein
MAKKRIFPKLSLNRLNPFRKKISYLTDDGKPQTVIRTGGSASKGITSNERSLAMLRKYWDYYYGEGTIFASINSITWNTVMSGYTIVSDDKDAKKAIEKLCMRINLEHVLKEAVTSTLVFGDSFLEKIYNKKEDISRLKSIDSRTMIVNADEHGDVINYQQNIGGQELPPLDPEDIIHIKFFNIPGSPYGMSLIAPNLDTIDRKVSTDESLFNAIKRHGTKKTIIYVGSEKDGQIPPPDVMDDIKEELEDINEKNEFVVPWYIKFDSMDEKGIEGVEEYFNYFQTQLVVGLLCPEEALGMGKGSTEATARIKAIMYERMIRSYQNDIAIILRENLFNPYLEKNGFEVDSVSLRFNNVTEEDEALRAKWLGNLLRGFAEGDMPFTKNEIRAFFGFSPLENMDNVPKKPGEVEEEPEEEIDEEEENDEDDTQT